MPHLRCILCTLLAALACGCAGSPPVAGSASASPRGDLRLHNAAWRGDVAEVKALLDAGADVNAKAPTQLVSTLFTARGTPLHFAVFKNHGDVVRLLVERGADLKAVNVHGFTPMAAAERLKRTHVAIILMEAEREASQNASQKAVRKAEPAAPPATASQPYASDIDRPALSLPQRPQDYALVIGIEDYSDLPAARFAGRDAQAVTEHLLALGFPSRNVVQLRGEKAGYKSIEKHVEAWLPNNVPNAGRVFFYFAGHGAPDPKTGEAYLLPWDGDPNYLERTGYPIKRLYEKLSALRSKEVIVAMDACFSGAGGRSMLPTGARPLVVQVDAAAVPPDLTVFAAASGEQITSTLEDQGHGTFTYHFLKGLSGGAKDPSGRVMTEALYNYLKPKVQDAARRQNRDQEPVLHSQGDRELIRF